MSIYYGFLSCRILELLDRVDLVSDGHSTFASGTMRELESGYSLISAVMLQSLCQIWTDHQSLDSEAYLKLLI